MPRTKKNKDVSEQTEGQAEPTTLRPWKQTPNGKENGTGKYVKAPQTLLKLDKCKYSFNSDEMKIHMIIWKGL